MLIILTKTEPAGHNEIEESLNTSYHLIAPFKKHGKILSSIFVLLICFE